MNRSALFDPPVITLEKGVAYPFREGNLTGSGQTFVSGYTYLRSALLSPAK